MSHILRKAVEDRRRKLIEQLIAFKVYQKDDKQLLELSLTELEKEYRRFQSHSHPHGDFGSLK